ncbi:hypothetical protein EDB19DRAFT_428759 [Suillus lakei]|nr:hypothetical protein EDB19DRAFT_428759 [Suillus lakei]
MHRLLRALKPLACELPTLHLSRKSWNPLCRSCGRLELVDNVTSSHVPSCVSSLIRGLIQNLSWIPFLRDGSSSKRGSLSFRAMVSYVLSVVWVADGAQAPPRGASHSTSVIASRPVFAARLKAWYFAFSRIPISLWKFTLLCYGRRLQCLLSSRPTGPSCNQSHI